MSTTRASFQAARQTTRHNPTVLALLGLAIVAMAITATVAGWIRFVSLTITLPLLGVFQAAVVGAVARTHRENTPLTHTTFTDTLREHWQSVFGAYLAVIVALLTVVSIVFEVLPYIGAAYLIGGGAARGGGIDFLTLPAIIGLVILAFTILIIVLGALMAQFLDVAVVIGNYSAAAAAGEATRLLTEAPLSVIGYTLARIGILVAGLLPAILVAALGLSMPVIGISLALPVGIITVGVALAFLVVFHAHYYTERRPQLAE